MAPQDVARYMAGDPLGDGLVAQLDQSAIGRCGAGRASTRRQFPAERRPARRRETGIPGACASPASPGSAGKRKRALARAFPQLAQCLDRGGRQRQCPQPGARLRRRHGDRRRVAVESTARHSSEHVSSARKPRRSVSSSASRVGRLTGTGDGSASGRRRAGRAR